MIVEVSVVHRASALPPRKRKPVPFRRTETVPFAIPGTDAASAPVALEAVVAARRMSRRPEDGKPIRTTSEIRVHAGRLWAPIPLPKSDRAMAKFDYGIGRLVAEASPFVQSWQIPRNNTEHRTEDEIPGPVVRSSLPSLRDRVQRRVSEDLLLVDGTMHERVLSPVLTIERAIRTYDGGNRRFSKWLPDGVVATWLADPAWLADFAAHIEQFRSHRGGHAEDVPNMFPKRILDADLLATCAADMLPNCDLSPECESASRERLTRAPRRNSSALGSWAKPGFADPEYGVAAWQVDLSRRNGDDDLASVRRAIVATGWTEEPTRIERVAKEPTAARTVVASAETAARLLKGRSGVASPRHEPLPPTVSIDRLDEGDVRTVCDLGGCRLVRTGDEFFVVDPELPPLARDGTDVLPDRAPFPELSLIERTSHRARAGDAVDAYARHVLVDIGGQLGWRCREPMLVVACGNGEPKVSLELHWWGVACERIGLKDRFAFHLDQLDEALAFARLQGLGDHPQVPPISNLDATLVGSAGHSWNLRFGMSRWIDALDTRAGFLPTRAKAALAEAILVLEPWRNQEEPRHDPEGDAVLLRVHAVLAPEMEDPFFDDIDHPAAMELVSAAAAALRNIDVSASHSHAASEDVAEFAGFAM